MVFRIGKFEVGLLFYIDLLINRIISENSFIFRNKILSGKDVNFIKKFFGYTQQYPRLTSGSVLRDHP